MKAILTISLSLFCIQAVAAEKMSVTVCKRPDAVKALQTGDLFSTKYEISVKDAWTIFKEGFQQQNPNLKISSPEYSDDTVRMKMVCQKLLDGEISEFVKCDKPVKTKFKAGENNCEVDLCLPGFNRTKYMPGTDTASVTMKPSCTDKANKAVKYQEVSFEMHFDYDKKKVTTTIANQSSTHAIPANSPYNEVKTPGTR